MRILQIMRAPVGGLFRHVADLSHELAQRGHKIGVVVDTLSADSQSEAKLEALSPDLELGIHYAEIPRTLGAGDITTPFSLRSLTRKLEIEVIHGHGAKGGFHARLARTKHTPTFYTPHGGVLHFDKASTNGRIFHALERRLMRRTDGIFFESEYARQTYATIVDEPTCPSLVVHNGLREDEFFPVETAPDAADFVFIGELRRLKGVHILLEALSKVHRRDGSPANALFVGDGPDRKSFEQLAGSLGLGSRVSMPGANPARDAFQRGRCVIVPSLAESLPYIVLEAIAAGKPVIATAVGGIPEIFGPNASELVPANDAEALRVAMQLFIDDPEEAARQTQRKSAYIRQKFSAARMAAQIEAQYRSAMHRD
ncbi:transferase [Devosia pacifica]|uniref:Transferase n=1 Tax=Devosia pacifica TaxID=1335967 RepID=A0A918VYW5_9HYPH|nr:glycosyltransferase family 4 protein [Devosia pacifica]GHA36753.1 transferase [Devosia pacifica]